MGNDKLSIVSFNSSRKGLSTLSPGQRPSYLQRILENAEPDICFLPGDDKSVRLNAIRGYGQFCIPNGDETVLLYNSNRVAMKEAEVSLNAFGQMPGLDYYQLVVPQVEVSTLQPYERVVKEFSMISWKFDLFDKASVHVDTLIESIITFSQRLALATGKPVLIGGEMSIDYNVLMKIVKKLSADTQEEYLASLQPVLSKDGYLPSMTRSSLRDVRHLFMMKVFRCKSNSSNGRMNTCKGMTGSVVADCFIASKTLELSEASLLDVEKVTGRQVCMPILKEYKPTQTSMNIPQRPPRHHGG